MRTHTRARTRTRTHARAHVRTHERMRIRKRLMVPLPSRVKLTSRGPHDAPVSSHAFTCAVQEMTDTSSIRCSVPFTPPTNYAPKLGGQRDDRHGHAEGPWVHHGGDCHGQRSKRGARRGREKRVKRVSGWPIRLRPSARAIAFNAAMLIINLHSGKYLNLTRRPLSPPPYFVF